MAANINYLNNKESKIIFYEAREPSNSMGAFP
jgi:hypothetical protein